MKRKNRLLILVEVLIPFCCVYGQKIDTTMAMLEDRQRTQRILNYLHMQEKEHNKTLVLYKEKFYSLSDVDLVKKLSDGYMGVKIIHQPDSIATVLQKRVRSLIILEEK